MMQIGLDVLYQFIVPAHPTEFAMPTPAVTNTVPVPNNSQGRNREPNTRPPEPKMNDVDVILFNWRKVHR